MTVRDTFITDPHLCECTEAAERTERLCTELLTTIESASPEHPDAAAVEQPRKQKQLNASMAQLKSLYRAVIMAARDSKEVTAEARREVDRLHLQLQNLYYEQRHLRGEVHGCREFPHKYSSLPLTFEAEYLDAHPEARAYDPHALMIARLNNEKAVREGLERQRKELVARKQALIAENKRRKEDLASLDDQLKKFIESSRPIQTTFQKEY